MSAECQLTRQAVEAASYAAGPCPVCGQPASDHRDDGVRRVEMKEMTLLGPDPSACQVCAVKHDPDQPHNPQSLYWQTKNHMEGKPSPTWEMALEHCDPKTQAYWVEALAERGVEVNLNDSQENTDGSE